MQEDRQHFLCTTEGFRIHDIDDSADPKYYGFVSHDHCWYIIKESTSAKTFRYCAGQFFYPYSWENRATALSGLFGYWYEQ